ncbi:hypothetical protein EKO27_g3446 [Xylaria grammica]|uniref:DUF7580 domain-containing protein n=1 Tax=Xylaria grammica TaxID=363999 RepID=A0A439DB54_9PEZI|nr:hypothetical protein EKO27_g3446 [Xylaria grammica]
MRPGSARRRLRLAPLPHRRPFIYPKQRINQYDSSVKKELLYSLSPSSGLRRSPGLGLPLMPLSHHADADDWGNVRGSQAEAVGMSGFEVVGVVLGSIPLLISALEHYERGIKTIQIVRRRAKVMHSLAIALSTEQTILRNTCETLLGGIIDPGDMGPLLADPFGPLWKDPYTEAIVERRLDHTLKDFKALVHSMKEAVEEIRSKLGLGQDFEIRIDDGPIGKRDMIKIALQFSTHEDSLKRLADTNQKLDLMMAGNLRNEPYRKDTKGKAHSSWVWDELVLRLAEIPTKERTMVTLPAVTNVVVKKPKYARVKFWVDDTTTPVVRTPSPLDSGGSMVGRGFDTSHQAITNPAGHIPLLPREARQLVQVKDICHALSGKRPDFKYQDPYGYLIDETTQKQRRFEVFPFRSAFNNDECTTINLRDVFSQGHRPSLAQKHHIAATAASSVLFMHNTLWMPATLTIKDLFLVSRQGNVDFNEVYLAKKSLHDLEGSKTAQSHGPSREAAGISTLFYLGIFLVEIMLWKSVYEFWNDEGVDLNGIPPEDIFDYTTAKGFARIESMLKQIEWISSPEFKGAVEHCIKCDINASRLSLDDDTFRRAVYNEIVLPLQDADQFAGGKMTVGGDSLKLGLPDSDPRTQTVNALNWWTLDCL